tara:strand:- start:614 stop:1444 length:831 start_codon:yes stop_codon:yes gene_type:complete
MAKFSSGKYAQFISDRSGLAFPYQEMVVEWTGARVHTSEFEPKSPQVSPKPHGADPQALEHARPRSPSIPSPGILNPDPLSMNATTTATVTLNNCQLQVGDAVTFLNVTDNSVGGVNNVLLSPFAILATNMTTTSSSIVCNETVQFPSSGYVFIESFTTPSATNPDYVPQKNFEVIKYTTNTTGTQTLSGLTRATNAPFRGITPPATTAFEHKVGANIFGAFNVASITTRTQNNPGMPAQITVNTGFTFTLPTAATTTEVGGGPNVYFSPVGRGSV